MQKDSTYTRIGHAPPTIKNPSKLNYFIMPGMFETPISVLKSCIYSELGITFQELRERNRKQRLADARKIFVLSVKKLAPDTSWRMIADLLNYRGVSRHSDAIAAYNRAKELIEYDVEFSDKFDRVYWKTVEKMKERIELMK